jgi:Raf kinase inhibitor-like YbhB/YbcL family protein
VTTRYACAVALLSLALAATLPAGAQQTQKDITVTSSAFSEGAVLPLRYAARPCGGENVAPPLAWSGVPPLARSVAITVFDPDARGGSGVWHWIVYDIPIGTTHLDASANGAELPANAVTGRNTGGTQAYFGPCPPRGESHHYRFTVYALDVPYVQDDPDIKAPDLVNRFTSHILAQGTLTASFSR